MFDRCRVSALPSLAVLSALAAAGCAVAPGDAAPNWTLKDTAGEQHAMEDYRGKVVVLDFWATWCGPCHAVSPHMQALHEKYDVDRVAVIGVHYDGKGDPKGYMRKKGYTFPVMRDGTAAVRAYGVNKIPTIIIVSPTGEVLYRKSGFSDRDMAKIERTIDEALADR